MEKLYLSRRNIVTLLEKLDRVRDGESSPCTIIKSDHAHPVYPQSMRRIAASAVESGDQYFTGVSQRLNLSRTTLTFLLDHLDKQLDSKAELNGMLVMAVPDEKYYVNRDGANITPVGDVSPASLKKIMGQ